VGSKQGGEALHAFFSWAAEGETSPMVASFHPGCLRWQVSTSILTMRARGVFGMVY
jgi:hypothetical protein